MSLLEAPQDAPKLRFAKYNGKKWLDHKLNEISTIRTGPFGTVLHQSDYVEVGTPIITVEHLSEFGVVHQNLPLVSDEDKTRLNSYVLKCGDIVFSRVGSVDRNSLVKDSEEGWLFSGRLLRIRLKAKKAIPAFLSLSLQQDYTKHRIRSVAVGQTMPSLNTAILNNFHVAIPADLSEQKKIASFLGAVDEKIAQLQKKKDLLEDYKKGCMQKLFSQEMRFKDDKGKDFPDWEEKQLKKIVSFSKGKGISKSDISENAKIPCIRYGEVYTIYSERITSTVSHTNLKSSDLILSAAGDVIIPASGEDHLDMARACCVEHDDIGLGGDLNILRGAQNGVFLAYYLNNAKKKNIARLAQGVSVVHLYGQQLKELTVLIPHIDEQKKIADFLSALDDKITLVSEELEKAKTFKKGLLQQMFV